MTSPLADPTDLQTFLGVDTIDTSRAALLIELAQDLCATVVTPLPATARAVVLDVAARAYGNPQGMQATHAGSFSVQWGAAQFGGALGGVFLTRGNKSTLRRLAGAGGAFSIDTLPQGTNAAQLITLTGSPAGGTFTLTFRTQTTAPIAYNASPVAVQAAIESLGVIGVGNTTVTGAAGAWAVTFVGTLGTTPLPPISGDGTALTGGVTPAVSVVVQQAGVFAPGQNIPYWDKDYYGGPSNTQTF